MAKARITKDDMQRLIGRTLFHWSLDHGFEYFPQIDQFRSPSMDMWRPWSQDGRLNPFTQDRILEAMDNLTLEEKARTLQPAIWKVVRYHTPKSISKDNEAETIALALAREVFKFLKIDIPELKSFVTGRPSTESKIVVEKKGETPK